MNLSGNTVLITGGASGIGFALARALLETDNQVIICGRNAHKLETAKHHLPRLTTITCDITQANQLADLQSRLSARFPRLNMLINNAGIQLPMDFSQASIDEAIIEQEIQTNLISHIKLTNRLLPILSSQDNSAVIFIGSALGRVPKHLAPVYCATKAGIHSFAQSLRYQLAATSTRVFEVVPDLVATPMTADRTTSHKITPEALAQSVMEGIKNEHQEILVGRTRLLFGIQRIMPRMAEAIINRPG
jgi:uncharacterized oxidoreductase